MEGSALATVPCLVNLQHLQALQLPENIRFELSDEIAAQIAESEAKR